MAISVKGFVEHLNPRVISRGTQISTWGAQQSFFVSKFMSKEIKLTASWSLDKEHLLFTPIGQDPETCYFYYVPRSDLLDQAASAHWMLHLCEKTWFTEELRLSVIELIGKAANGMA